MIKRLIIISVILIFHTSVLAQVYSANNEFAKAQKLYSEKKALQAQKKLLEILNKFPGHQASISLLIEILWQQKKIKSIKQAIDKFKPKYIDSTLAFNIGMHFYETKQCKSSVQILRMIPPEGVLYENAKLYQASCLMRAQKWTAALGILQNTQTVSPELEATKRDLLKSARENSRFDRQVSRGGLLRNHNEAPTLYVPPSKTSDSPKVVAQETSKYSIQTTPRFGLDYRNRLYDQHGINTYQDSRIRYTAALGLNQKYLYRDNKDYLGLLLDVNYDTYQTNVRKEQNYLTSDNNSEISTSSSNTTGDVLKTMLIKVGPSGRYSFNPYWGVVLKTEYGKYFYDYLNYVGQKVPNTGYLTLGLSTDIAVDNVNIDFSFENKKNSTLENQAFLGQNIIRTALAKNWDSLSADIAFGYTINSSLAKTPEYLGPAQVLDVNFSLDYKFNTFSLGAGIDVKQQSVEEKKKLDSFGFGSAQLMAFKVFSSVPLPYSIGLNLNLASESYGEYRLPGKSTVPVSPTDPNSGDIIADGQAFVVNPIVNMKLFDFLSFKFSYIYRQTAWKTQKEQDKNVFEDTVDSLYNEFNISLVLSKTL